MGSTKKMALKFIKDYPENYPIVTPSASCAAYVRKHYAQLLQDEPNLQHEVERLKNTTFELTDFLVNQLKITDFGTQFPHKITYHDACSALRDYGLKDEPRTLLRNVQGLELEET